MSNQAEKKVVVPLIGPQLVSINSRDKLDEVKDKFPNLEIVIGKAEPDDKPVSLDLAEMESTRQHCFDAATESILGKRIDKFYKPRRFPLPAVTWVVGFLMGVGSCFTVYNF